jgi:hypothetical protein
MAGRLPSGVLARRAALTGVGRATFWVLHYVHVARELPFRWHGHISAGLGLKTEEI